MAASSSRSTSFLMTFSSPKYLELRTGKWGTPRPDYLQQLVTEFSDTEDQESREQILANLANFAYDPINYDTLFELHVPDLFVDALDEQNPKFIEFASAGICNCCLDPRMAAVFTGADSLPLIIKGLSSPNEEVVLNTIATLYFLVTPQTYSRTNRLVLNSCFQTENFCMPSCGTNK
jgi:hypothetical protein